MEVVHHRVEEEGEEEEQLQTRRGRLDLGDGSGDSSDENSAKVMNINGYKSEEDHVETNGIAQKSVYFDKNQGIWKCHHCIWTHKFAHPWIDHVHQKSFIHAFRESTVESSLSDKDLITEELNISKLVNAIINNPNGGNLDEKILSTFGLRSEEENVRIDLVEESDEEVIELEFERAVEKTHTHTPYCPNCSSRITKVVLRRKKRETLRREKPVNLLGCLECFSIFIPSGNFLNPFRLFGSKGKQEIAEKVEDKLQSTLKGKQETAEIVEDKLQSGANLPDSEGGSTSSIKQGGDAFDLFRIFNTKTENINVENSRDSDQVKHDGEKINGEVNIKKPGRFHQVSSPHPSSSSGDVKIDIGDEKTDGIIRDKGKASIKQEIEIKEDQSTKARELIGEGLGETTSDKRGENEANVGKLAAVLTSTAYHGSSKSLEILKCIVYGGLIELITSLSIVSSAAASDATTLNIIAIGLATVFSGLIIFGQNLMDLKNNTSNSEQQHTDKYTELLGTRGNFPLHASFAVFSYLVFGLLPPTVYGFTFRESDNKDYKILAVGVASFACIFLLAIAKTYVMRSKKVSDYVKSIMYYMAMAISVSGVSYAAGDLIKMVMEKLGWFEPTQAVKFLMPGAVLGSASF